MTLQELYSNIDGDYTQATKVLRVDKLINKHISRLPDNKVVDSVIEAGKTMDANALFETSHAMKGVCANLGLVRLAELASEISEEFRPGNPRTHSDAQVAEIIDRIKELYGKTVDEIQKYKASL